MEISNAVINMGTGVKAMQTKSAHGAQVAKLAMDTAKESGQGVVDMIKQAPSMSPPGVGGVFDQSV